MTSTPRARETSENSELPEEVVGVILTLALATEHDDGWRQTAATAVAGKAGDACRAALVDMSAQPRSERARTISGLVQQLMAPVPEGIGQAHPSWLRAALEGEATEVLVAVVEGMPEAVGAVAREIVEGRGGEWVGSGVAAGDGDADGVGELRRAIFSHFVAMGGAGADDGLDRVRRAGASMLGRSLAGAPPEVLARAAVGAGTNGGPLGEVLAAARGEVSVAERERARAFVAAAAGRRGEGTLGPAYAVGLVSLAHDLAGELPSVVRAIAQGLPLALGRVLLDLHRRAADIIDGG